MKRKITEADINAIADAMMKSVPPEPLFREVKTKYGVAYTSPMIDGLVLCGKDFKSEVIKGFKIESKKYKKNEILIK